MRTLDAGECRAAGRAAVKTTADQSNTNMTLGLRQIQPAHLQARLTTKQQAMLRRVTGSRLHYHEFTNLGATVCTTVPHTEPMSPASLCFPKGRRLFAESIAQCYLKTQCERETYFLSLIQDTYEKTILCSGIECSCYTSRAIAPLVQR